MSKPQATAVKAPSFDREACSRKLISKNEKRNMGQFVYSNKETNAYVRTCHEPYDRGTPSTPKTNTREMNTNQVKALIGRDPRED